MRRGILITLIVLAVLSVTLMVTVAWNGSQLDEARQEREDLQFEVDDLNQEVDALTSERDELQSKLDEHLKTIEQLKSQTAASSAAPATEPAPAAQ